MDTLDILDKLDYLRARPRFRKVYRKRRNPFLEYSEEEFRNKYRFSKENSRKLIKLVESEFRGEERRGGSIPPHIQVLAALRCWGVDHAQIDCAEYHGFSQSTMSRVCAKVALAFSKKANSIIKMATLAEDQMVEMEKFEQLAGLKNVIGAIDCTKIDIHALGKCYFPLNIQVVCDASLKITDMAACWKETKHDCKIFSESKIKKSFEEGAFMGRLIGDSSYKCTDYLFTPIRNPVNLKEISYNEAHLKTRNVVEKVVRSWKNRFRILSDKIRISRANGKPLIVALAVLHNLAVLYKDQNFDDDDAEINILESETALPNNSEDENPTRDIYIQENFKI